MIVLGLRRLNLKARFFLLSFSFHTCRRVTFTTSFLRRHTQVHFSVTIDVRPVILFLGGSLAAASEIIGNINFFVFHNHRGHILQGFSFRESGSNEKKNIVYAKVDSSDHAPRRSQGVHAVHLTSTLFTSATGNIIQKFYRAN